MTVKRVNIRTIDLQTYPIAYLDPALFTLVFQVLAGAALTAIVTVSLWWGRFTDIMSRLLRRESKDS